MPRKARIVIKGEPAIYHVMSRTALEGFVLGDTEKDYLLHLIKHFGSIYFCDILGFCLMRNHFHIVIRMHPDKDYSDNDVRDRYALYYQNDKSKSNPLPGQLPLLREKWQNLSEFMKEVKQSFSRFYNKKHHRRGFFWSERFKSVLVENGEALINCLAYVDLNPIRAGIVDRPDAYRWNGIGYHQQTSNNDGLLSLDFGIEGADSLTTKQRFARYRKFVYEAGALSTLNGKSIAGNIVAQAAANGFATSTTERFLARTRYFTDSGIIGSKEFVHSIWRRLKADGDNPVKSPIRIAGLEGLYSLKKLRGIVF